MSETSEKLDHTLRAYGRLERKHGERGRELTAVKAERDAYKSALEAIVHFAREPHSVLGVACGEGPCLGCLIEGTARSVLAGVVSTREKDDERPT